MPIYEQISEFQVIGVIGLWTQKLYFKEENSGNVRFLGNI